MAILVEEERKPINWMAILTLLVVVGSLFIGAYFFFFKNPEVIDIVLPAELKELDPITKVTFEPKPVIDSLNKYFKERAAPLTLPVPGRENPFKPF